MTGPIKKLNPVNLKMIMDGFTQQKSPDFELIGALSASVSVPEIAEGRINTSQEAARTLVSGA